MKLGDEGRNNSPSGRELERGGFKEASLMHGIMTEAPHAQATPSSLSCNPCFLTFHRTHLHQLVPGGFGCRAIGAANMNRIPRFGIGDRDFEETGDG